MRSSPRRGRAAARTFWVSPAPAGRPELASSRTEVWPPRSAFRRPDQGLSCAGVRRGPRHYAVGQRRPLSCPTRRSSPPTRRRRAVFSASSRVSVAAVASARVPRQRAMRHRGEQTRCERRLVRGGRRPRTARRLAAYVRHQARGVGWGHMESPPQGTASAARPVRRRHGASESGARTGPVVPAEAGRSRACAQRLRGGCGSRRDLPRNATLRGPSCGQISRGHRRKSSGSRRSTSRQCRPKGRRRKAGAGRLR